MSKNVHPGGRILVEKAMEIAAKLNLGDFKASNGWLDRWKKKHDLRLMNICGESGSASSVTVDSWKERIPEITPLNLNYAVSVLYTIHCQGTLAIILLCTHCNDKKVPTPE